MSGTTRHHPAPRRHIIRRAWHATGRAVVAVGRDTWQGLAIIGYEETGLGLSAYEADRRAAQAAREDGQS